MSAGEKNICFQYHKSIKAPFDRETAPSERDLSDGKWYTGLRNHSELKEMAPFSLEWLHPTLDREVWSVHNSGDHELIEVTARPPRDSEIVRLDLEEESGGRV